MAELLAAKGWLASGSLASRLEDALPDEYYVIPEPTVRGVPLDTIVVGPQAVFVLHLRDWSGDVAAVRRGPWRERRNGGPEVVHANPMDEARRATDALRAFLRDEFPRLAPPVRNLLVLTSPSVRLVATDGGEPLAMTPDTVADAIVSSGPQTGGVLADDEVREALAVALRERQLTATQRAKRPFVFRSGDLLSSGTTVWTIRGAVRHIDRHPEDGIYHLRNGTLAAWLNEQGAGDLAELARDVMRQRITDDRMALESFVLATGLVRRPRLVTRPARVDCGYVLSGEAVYRPLRIVKGRGRGHLFGSVQPSHSWIRIEPRSFAGDATNMAVHVSTETLPIGRTHNTGEIRVSSSASAAPIDIPVRVRVMGMPSPVNRYVLRPLAGLIAGGAIGGGLGWLLGSWGALNTPWMTGAFGPWGAGALGTALLIGFFWAMLGAYRGVVQPLAWPVGYALGRWLARTLLWMVGLVALTAIAMWVLRWAYPPAGDALSDAIRFTAVLVAPAFAVLPAVVGEVRVAHAKTVAGQEGKKRRPLVAAFVAVALLCVLAISVRVFRPMVETAEIEASAVSAQEWTMDRWVQLERGLNDAIDRLMIRLYDRRAPAGG